MLSSPTPSCNRGAQAPCGPQGPAGAWHCPSPAPQLGTTILGSLRPSSLPDPTPRSLPALGPAAARPPARPSPYLGEHLLELALGHGHGGRPSLPVSVPPLLPVPPARPYINTGSGRAPASGGGAAPARHGAGTERLRHRGERLWA